MVDLKKIYMTVGQIDATGVRGPHEKELEDISAAKYSYFTSINKKDLQRIIEEDLGGKLENIGFNEDWTISVEMFPEVNIHMAFSYYGDEFGDGIEAEFKYYFSGERVWWVPGEDSATFIDIIMDFLVRKIKNEEPFEKNYAEKTELMQKVLIQRSEPFNLLQESDVLPLSEFIGGVVWKTNNSWNIRREAFPNIFIEITWQEEKGLDITFQGENLSKNIGSYHIELVGIFTINQILRYISIKYANADLPDICKMMFSRYYTKKLENK
ncbi:MAG: hypothetical protein JW891_12440 [Candidatus Lokiarchaeota archaeon]|nr:hypothetical protein [Candidatus Lokiarchaeota archaeon]